MFDQPVKSQREGQVRMLFFKEARQLNVDSIELSEADPPSGQWVLNVKRGETTVSVALKEVTPHLLHQAAVQALGVLAGQP